MFQKRTAYHGVFASGILENMNIRIVKTPISKTVLKAIAEHQFGDFVKAAVDIAQGVMAVGGELHMDEEVALIEREGSRSENVWGINLYCDKMGDEFIEFDSMINLKPASGNRSRGVDSPVIREEIKKIVAKLVKS